ncbi:MAG: protein kinase, partial [Planctomycetales bacterium]|nr:protein kinase [Planctomycetales bacterium]
SPVPGYKLEKFLGKGNFGEVWQSTSPGGTKSALKFLNLRERQGRKEFRAIQRLKQIRHANLMPINAMWLLDEAQQVIPDDNLDAAQPFMEDTRRQSLTATLLPASEEHKPKTLVIAMPLAEGNLLELLHQRQEQGKDIPPEELLMYLMDAARALDFLNSARHDYDGEQVAVQHGDVKPENLVLLGGSVVLCDFGVARTMGGGADTRGTSLGGSLAYMAPECMAGQVSPHSDQFSLAISYAELRTGHLPFNEDSMTQVIEDRRKGRLDLEGLTPGEQRVIRKACSIQPNKRYDSNVALVEDLRAAVLGTASTTAKPAWLLAGGMLLALGLAVWGLMVAFAPPRDTPAPPPPPQPKSGAEYYADALRQIAEPQLNETQLAEATQLVVTALEHGFRAETPKPQFRGVQRPLEVYGGPALSYVSQLFAVHPLTKRTLLVGSDGRSLIEPQPTGEDLSRDLQLDAPIASLHWLDEDQVLVRDCQANLVRVELGSQSQVEVSQGVVRVASSPSSQLAIAAASDGDATVQGEVLLISSSGQSSLLSPDASRGIVSPLIAMDTLGRWAVLFEEFDSRGTASILDLRSPGGQQPLRLDTLVDPTCSTCLRSGEQCYAIVGGVASGPLPASEIAVIPLTPAVTVADVRRPPTADIPWASNIVRSLAASATSPDQATSEGQQVVGHVAMGQVDPGDTLLWQVLPDGQLAQPLAVGQPIQGESISALAFDSSGQWLARGSNYGEVRLTKLSEPEVDFPLWGEAYNAEVLQLQFVDGKLLAAFDDASVLIWNFHEIQMIFEACRQKQQAFPQPDSTRPPEA